MFDDFEADSYGLGFDSSYTVSELTRRIKLLIEEGFPALWVEGEISNFKRHSSGHLYFSLKDANAQINCVMWRGRTQSLAFQAVDGMKVCALGNVTLYEKQGKYQLDIIRMQPLGTGELQMAFEALKQRLDQEGLFDVIYKKELPEFPETIGVVTSATGAAIQDIVSVLDRRFPCVRVILRPVHVQGAGAAEEIAQAIEAFNRLEQADVIIVGRGGGSIEDLWPFNEEIVVRAIFDSRIPVVSAVGHEIDFSISDFVADLRAPTPSAAAEMVVPDRNALLRQLEQWEDRMFGELRGKIDFYQQQLKALKRSYGLRWPQDRIRQYRLQLDDMQRQLQGHKIRIIDEPRNRITRLQSQLKVLNPEAVLARGYSITTRIRDGQTIVNASDVEPGEKIHVRVHRGGIEGVVEEIRKDLASWPK